jgi:hypothetical protein
VRAAANIARDMLTREALSEWLALYPALPVSEPRNVLIIMAGNIPFVGMHDLVCTLAAGHRAIVKPSSRDRENMTWVVEQLLDIAPDLPVSVIENDNYQLSIINYQLDAVIAMGGDDTVAAIAEKYAGIPMLLRGNRSSLAVLGGNETADELEGLADDVLMYSGLGCRNVSLVWVPRGYAFSALQSVLAAREESLGAKYRGNLRQTRAMLRMGGAPHLDCGASLLVETTPSAVPAATPPQEGNPHFPAQPSILNYAFYDDPQEAVDWIARHEREIQCVVSNYQLSIINYQLSIINYQLGSTQRPRLTDYPDGRDTMKFLETI